MLGPFWRMTIDLTQKKIPGSKDLGMLMFQTRRYWNPDGLIQLMTASYLR